ncbi:hypothetical protein E4U34_004981 [Claviceps purpurea]|nr:hypothetical protein E4U50_007501 [Claviceps purpurea]KAG6216829.1 hypothetical protein E4U34_004981 [Claviceps purpurea]
MTSRAGIVTIPSLLSPERQTNQSEERKSHPWLPHEDYLLMCMVKGEGARGWAKIAAVVGSRSAKQCRERWHQNLASGLNHDPITREEGEQILCWVDEKGHRWAEMARLLKNRSDNTVKNWYYGQQNRIMREEDAQPLDLQQEAARQVSSAVTNFVLPLPSAGFPSLPRISGHAYFQTVCPSSRLLSPCASDNGEYHGNVNYTTSVAAQRPRSPGIIRYFPEPPPRGPCVWHKGGKCLMNRCTDATIP